jgi:glycosyl transferase family 87
VSPNFTWADVREGPYAGDFLHEYTGASIVREGDRTRLYDLAYFQSFQHDAARLGFTWHAQSSYPPLYPPFYYTWVAPLARLDYRSAAWLWTALAVAALVAAVALLVRDGGPRAPLGAWLAASLCYVPIAESIASGQKGTFLLLVFAGTYRLLEEERPFWGGVVFGFAAFKPQLVLVLALVMLVRREWRFLGGMAATGALLAAQSLWLGWQPSLDWIAEMLHPIPQPELIGRAHGWLGFARLLLGAWSGPAVLGLAVALVAVTLAVLFRVVRAQPPRRIAFSAIVVATALASPYLYTYDLAILAVPLILLARELAGLPSAERRLQLGALLFVFAMGGASTRIAEHVPIQLSAVASATLLAWLGVRVARDHAAAAIPAGAPQVPSA